MRRISLALALIGAVAATGCGGGAKPASSTAAKGTAGVNFTVTVNNQGGGTVSDGTQTCAANTTCSWTYSSGTTVNLTQTPGALYFNGWFGDCQGTGACALSGNSDKYVVAFFSTSVQGHPNFVDPKLHGPAYFSFQQGAQGALVCTQCHGAQLQGVNVAPSCNMCHNLTLVPAPSTGHFDPNEAAWQENGSPCYRCHTTQGFQNWVGLIGTAGYEGDSSGNYLGSTFLYNGPSTINGVTAPATGPLQCAACHNSVTDVVTAGITDILFKSGVKVTTTTTVALCGQCHMGREGKVSIDTKIGAKLPLDFSLSFVNPHYLGAAGVMFGSNTHMMYEYSGKTYATYPVFYGNGTTNGAAPGPYGSPHGAKCTACHVAKGGDHFTPVDLGATIVVAPVAGYTAPHTTTPWSSGTCDSCHTNGASGDHRLEPVAANVNELAAQLLVEINAYQVAAGQNPVCYSAANYPYWYVATANAGGVCGSTETTQYGAKFDAKSLKATFNFQWSQKEPGAFAHNGDYVMQTLIDSIQDLDPAGVNAVLPCDAHDSLCAAAQMSEGVLTPAGAPYTGTSFIVRP